jgi:OmpA-OmpF porin, OOP family
MVEGHTDNIGGAAPNKALSQARAQAVRSALAQRGLDVARMDATGYGFDKPVGPNDTPEGRATNRRIEIKAAN